MHRQKFLQVNQEAREAEAAKEAKLAEAAKRKEERAAAKAEKEGRLPRNLSFGEVIAALITAPALGIIAYGIGGYFQMPGTVIAAMAGFAGLAGPGALLALWDALVEPVVKRLRP